MLVTVARCTAPVRVAYMSTPCGRPYADRNAPVGRPGKSDTTTVEICWLPKRPEGGQRSVGPVATACGQVTVVTRGARMGGRFRFLNPSDTGLSENHRGSSYWTVGSDRGKKEKENKREKSSYLRRRHNLLISPSLVVPRDCSCPASRYRGD